jgi:hypothetical protein
MPMVAADPASFVGDMKLKCRRNDRGSSDDDAQGRRTRFDVVVLPEVSDETVPNAASSRSPKEPDWLLQPRRRSGYSSAAAELLRQARWVRLLTV